MGGKNGESRKKSDKNKRSKFPFLTDPFIGIFKRGSQAVYDELHTGAGRANFFLDTVLALLVLLFFFSKSSIMPFIRIFIAIRYPDALKYIDDSSILVDIGILVFFIFVCLIFMAIVEHVWNKRNAE